MLVFSGCSDVTRSRFIEYQESLKDFGDLVEGFHNPNTFKVREKKEQLPLLLPAEFAETYVRRCNNNVLRIHFLVIDIDQGTPEELARPFELIDCFGHIVYTSFSHDPAGQGKYRVLIKLSRPVDITEWRAFWPRAMNYFEVLKFADGKCKDPAHMYYVPGGDPSKYWYDATDGAALDVDMVLKRKLPEGEKEAPIHDYTEILPEDERGEISQPLRDYWEALLQHLVQEIYDRPYPGSFYDLKAHRVFYIARGCPHIMDPDRLRRMVHIAMDARYRNAHGEAALNVDADRERSLTQVEEAIESGMGQPWYPPIINEIPVRPFTEYGLAERFVDAHKADVKFEPTWDAWLTWNGKHWDQVAGGMLVQEKMKSTVRDIANEAKAHYAEYWVAKKLYEGTKDDANVTDDVKSAAEFDYEEKKKLIEGIRAFALKNETASKTSSAIVLARSMPSILTSHQLFDQDPWAMNFQNGTLDLRTGVFREHIRDNYITRILPYSFDPDAKCPLFDKFLSDCMLGNEDMVNFLWRVMGYTACGVTDEQKVFICHGDGANGKSTFLGVLLDIFGQGGNGYGFAANSSNLMSSKGSEQHATWRMDMAMKRFVATLEVDEGRSLAESLLKELTGGDIITGRRMRQDNWSYKPEFTLWLAINHLPHVRGTDEGIWRRLVVIEFNASFKDRPDKDLPRKLKAEAAGIWARIAREAKAWCTEGLRTPREVIASSAAYRQEQDPLKDFIERWCTIEKDGSVARSTLWAAYEEYCSDQRSRTFHERKRFYAALEKQYTVKTIDGYRFFAGLRLKTPKERLDAMPRSILARAQKSSEEKPN